MTGFIYAIGDGEGRVKIGWSADPLKRLIQLNVGRPLRATLVGVIEATKAHEAEAHELLGRWRLEGEWFRHEGPVAQFVGMLPKPKPRPVKLPASDIGFMLKAARERVGENQTQFAKRFGVAQQVYWSWETGKNSPSTAAMLFVEKVLSDLNGAAE